MARGAGHPPDRRIPPPRRGPHEGCRLAELVRGDAFVACLVAQEGQLEVVAGPRFRIE